MKAYVIQRKNGIMMNVGVSVKNLMIRVLVKSVIFAIFCINYKCYIMIQLTCLKELVLIKQMHQKSAIFITNGIF